MSNISKLKFYVAPDGCDTADGGRAAPFATIGRAQAAAREAGGAEVEVMKGTYRESLVFDSRDNGSVYVSHENAVITGGLTVTADGLEEVSEEIKDRLYSDAAASVRVIDLKKYGVGENEYATLYPIGTYSTNRQYDDCPSGENLEVFENDSRMTLARYPNEGYLKLDGILDMGEVAEFPPQNYWREWGGIRNPRGGMYIIDRGTNERLKNWKAPETAWMFGYFFHDWADASTPITVNTKNRAVMPRFAAHYGAKAGALYYLYNVLEELDSPGEFYLDRESGLLYVYPRFDGSSFEISLGSSELVKFDGAENMTFDGFTLKCVRANAVSGSGSSLTVRNLLVKNISGNAVSLSGNDILVENCEVTRTGRGGILLTGGDRNTLTPGNNRAVNNYVHDFSEVYQTYQSGIAVFGVGNTIAHNEISGSPHQAISYSGNDNIIEYNYIHDVVLHSSDAGAIYSGYDWTAHGNVMRYNLLETIGGDGFEPDGIYWDDGLSGQTAYGNILINVKKNGFLAGGGRDNTIRDNIIIGNGLCPLSYDDRNRDGFVNGGWARQSCNTPDAPHWRKLSSVPYKSEIWTKRYPTLARVITDFDRYNDPDFPINPANCTVENNVIIHGDRKMGWIADSVREYSHIGENFVYATPLEADFDMDKLEFSNPREGFPEIPSAKIGREAAPAISLRQKK